MRTFLALDLDETIRDRIVAAAQRSIGSMPGLRWTAPPNLHVTLQFLGDVTEDLLEHVCRLMTDVAAIIDPFDFVVKGVTCVPPGGDLRMLRVGIQDPGGLMNVLHDELDLALADLGLHEEERGFAPHVTLARVKSVVNQRAIRQAALLLAGEDFGTQHCKYVTAYTSQLTPDGPIYAPLAKSPLGGQN